MIKVLIADDSLTMRAFLTDAVSSAPDVQVIATANDGRECVDKTLRFQPDVILLDLEMPVMGGLDALNKIMNIQPTPVIIVSIHAKEGAEATIKALEHGAFDYVEKPISAIDIHRLRNELHTKIRHATEADAHKIRVLREQYVLPAALQNLPRSPKKQEVAIVMGASAGGPQALFSLFRMIPSDFPCPILVVQHMPKDFTPSFAARLNSICGINVKEAEEGDTIISGRALVAPGGYHMEVLSDGSQVRLLATPPINFVRPSVDVTMISAASAFRKDCIGVLLTGMGSDGAKGMLSILQMGGVTIAEHKSTSVVYGMPQAAIKLNAATKILPLDKIVPELIRMLNSVSKEAEPSGPTPSQADLIGRRCVGT